MIAFFSIHQDKGAHAIDFCMQLVSLSVLEDQHVQRSFFAFYSVKKAGYWPRSFLGVFMNRDEGQYHLDLELGQ